MTGYQFWAAISVVCVLTAIVERVHGDETIARREIAKWAGNYDTDAFLREPAIHAELQTLLGPEFKHLLHNLNVRGAVDLSGQTLSVNGNAPHQGTEEEAIVCVSVLPLKTIVEAAILSKDMITVYAREKRYEYTSICVKDWITLANSRHADRIRQPANVQMVVPLR